jgi:ADP-heptose:LPS heptosyltransferase
MSALLDDEPATVAVMRMRTGLGDLLCGVPALRALRRRLPRAHIALVTFGEMEHVVRRQRRYVDELVDFPGWPGIPERPTRHDERPAWVATVRRRRFDLAVNAYGGRPAAREVTRAVGARRSAGFRPTGTTPTADAEGWLAYPEHLHEIERQLALMALLGAPADDRRLEFPLEPADETAAAAVAPPHPYVVLHPGATSPSRRWAPERFARVGNALAGDGFAVAITGVRGEEPIVAAVASAMRAPAVDLCGATSLGPFAALLRGAALLVTNDTGAAHLAAAVVTRSVTCFLAGDPVRWAHDDRRHRVARASVGCNPCAHLTCPIDHRCATRLTTAHVVDEARAALAA